MGLWLRLAAFALALAGAAAAEPAAYDYTRFVLPEGWVRNDEQRYGSYSPPGGGVTLSILTRFGRDDADDTLKAFVRRSERDEESLDRSRPERLSTDGFRVFRQETRSRAADGRLMRRYYLAADKARRATVVVIEGDEANYGRVEAEARGIVSSLRLVDDEQPALSAPEDLAGEGGLDGLYVAGGARGFLDVGTMRWAYGERLEALYFDPLGGVYRGPPARFDVDVFQTCVAATAWRCGRYRIEGQVMLLRWADGSVERRSFAAEGDALRLGDKLFRPAGGGGTASGAYAMADLFNTGDWPVEDGDRKIVPYAIRFLDDGRFQLTGVSGFRNPRVGAAVTAAGRFKIDGNALTLVYTSGSSEVVGFARFPGTGGELLLIGGKVFMQP